MGMVITDMASAQVKLGVTTLYGTTTSNPTLLLSDGLNVQWVCDVNIGEFDASGEVNQYIKKNGQPGSLTGLPGQPPEDWQLDDSLPGHVDTSMHNVPIARNNEELRYAQIGAPVVLTRNLRGQWEITGFSQEQPGTHIMYPVDLGDGSIRTIIDLTTTIRMLTLAELGEIQPFGAIPFGAGALFKGQTFIRVTV